MAVFRNKAVVLTERFVGCHLVFNICWSRDFLMEMNKMLSDLLDGIRSIVQGKFTQFSKMRGWK
uniref:Uncharacterized protein n=1 Tax=Triticum urartu TaxID=4572 RepID=A0A8R7TKU5_TRIUA